jgi:peptide/nickel transport system substrate-binding protein/oligopeptide transport system substrate-binding protein
MLGSPRRFPSSQGWLIRGVLGLILLITLAACGGAPAGTPASSASTPDTTGKPQRGGTMTVAYQNDIATLDPAIGYDWNNWPMEKMAFDALMDYDSGTTLVPQLAAEMPKVNADATVYTFKLRPGVKFHNGRELSADDVIYTITRVLDPKTKSPGQGFFLTIKGAQEFIDGKAPTVAGITQIDPLTVEFTLAQSDVTFLNVMALNFAFIVPKEEVEKYKDDFGHHPVGTGPFIFDTWTSGQKLTFKRNPSYFKPELPYLDGVEVQIGATPEVNVLKLEKGELDLLGDTLPPAEFVRLTQDPAWQNRIVHQTWVNTSYIAINTQVEPFDNLKVRQAINMAINKNQIVKLMNGRAQVASGILPPLMPGYDPNIKGYDYNVAQAKALLADAGFPSGFKTSITCISVDPEPKICESFQNDLKQIGVELEIKTLANSTVIADASSPGKTPLVWSGQLAWTQDYPDPADFYGPILSCASAQPGGWNWSWYCNKDLDAQAAQALGTLDHDARMKAYQAIFQKLMDDAVWVPVYHLEQYIGHSETLHGEKSDFLHPVHTFMYERLWKAK